MRKIFHPGVFAFPDYNYKQHISNMFLSVHIYSTVIELCGLKLLFGLPVQSTLTMHVVLADGTRLSSFKMFLILDRGE